MSLALRQPDQHHNLAPHQGEKMPFLSTAGRGTVMRTVIIVLILLLIAHAPMALNDSLYMDDCLVLKARADHAIDFNFLLLLQNKKKSFLYGKL